MSASLINKVLDFVGWEVEEEEIATNELQKTEQEQYAATGTYGKKSNQGKVVSLHNQSQFKVVIMNPETFEDAREITEHLRNKKPVVINLMELDKDFAQRILDFLSGAVCALDGAIQKVTNGIFVVAPNNVDVMGEFKDQLKNKTALFPWVK